MTAQLKDPLVWIDYEMTSLDVHKDVLVEVGIVTTDVDLKIVDRGIDVLIKPPAVALENMSDFMRDMHTASGLLDELGGGLSPEEIAEQVLDYIRRFVPGRGRALLMDNSAGTDKMLPETYVSSVINHLHYRTVDVSSVKKLTKCWYRRAFENVSVRYGDHRTLTDILESIQELECYHHVLFPAKPVTCAQARAAFKDTLTLKIPAVGGDEQFCAD